MEPPIPHLIGEPRVLRVSRFASVPTMAWPRLIGGLSMIAMVCFLVFRVGQTLASNFMWVAFGIALLSLAARDFKQGADDRKQNTK